MKWTAWWSLVLVGLMTTSCGGGGGGRSSSAGSEDSNNAAIKVSATSGDCAYLGDFFADLLDLTNEAREDAGLKPLRSAYQLGVSAQEYAEDLATQNFFSHQGKDGSTLSTRVAATGYDFAAAGENIAAGQRTAEKVFDDWMRSDGHRKNILAEGYTEVGFGLFDATGSSDFGKYWVQNFGKPDGGSSQGGVYIPGSCGVQMADASGGNTRVAGVSVRKASPDGGDARSLPAEVATITLVAAVSDRISVASDQTETVPEPAALLGLASLGLALWGDSLQERLRQRRRY